jgi:hypothetical protein
MGFDLIETAANVHDILARAAVTSGQLGGGAGGVPASDTCGAVRQADFSSSAKPCCIPMTFRSSCPRPDH